MVIFFFLFSLISLFSNEKLDLLGLSAAIMDHAIYVSDDELATITADKGSWAPLSRTELENILQRFEGRITTGPGGSGANLVKGNARLGKKCAIIGQIGPDAIGKKHEKRLREYGIETHFTKQSLPTGQSVCMITPDGQRTMRTYLGSSHAVGATKIDRSLLARAEWLHIEGYQLIDEPLVLEIVEAAQSLGVKISLDLANPFIIESHRAALDTILPKLNLLFCNEDEARSYTGCKPKDAATQLSNICSTVVVTRSEKGCIVGQKGCLYEHPARCVAVKDTTGAGDFFAGGFLAATIGRCPASEAARIGTLFASEVIQVTGAELPVTTWETICIEAGCPFLAVH